MNENPVESDFNNFYNKDLKRNLARDIDVETEEFDTEKISKENEPVSKSTRDDIIKLLNLSQDNTNATNIMGLMDRISIMTEGEAKRYYEALQFSFNESVDNEFVKIAIENATDLTFNPSNPRYKESVLKDRFVHRCASGMLTQLLGKIGPLAGFAMFFLYAAASWKVQKYIDEENKTGNINTESDKKKRKRDDPKTSLPDDVLGKKPNRKNIPSN